MAAPKKQVLAPSELKALADEKQELESTIKELEEGAGDGTRGAGIDKNQLKRQAAHLGKKIEDGTPVSLKGAGKDKLAKRAEELAAKIQEGMPTDEQMRNPARFPGIVRSNLGWQRRNSPLIAEYKQLMRQLEPGDPMASSVEKLRKSK